MKQILRTIFLFAILFLTTAYTKPAGVPQHVWDATAPYFLPETHPMKPKLDEIFSKARVTQNLDTLKKAKFKFKKRAKADNIIIAKHPKLKGVLLKLYTDAQSNLADWPMWVQRINGANHIRSIIANHNYKTFVVPKKWIYPLPANPAPAPGPNPKYFVLVVEDMRLVDSLTNENMWKSSQFVYEGVLSALYTIMQEGGLLDSIYIDNIPFNKDYKIAFIDTEHYDKRPVPYSRLTKWLPSSKQAYWTSITGGQ